MHYRTKQERLQNILQCAAEGPNVRIINDAQSNKEFCCLIKIFNYF
jgi:hypothetical protein